MPHDIIGNRIRELASEINDFLADSVRAFPPIRDYTCYPSRAMIQPPLHTKRSA